jgi:hypothetical protein
MIHSFDRPVEPRTVQHSLSCVAALSRASWKAAFRASSLCPGPERATDAHAFSSKRWVIGHPRDRCPSGRTRQATPATGPWAWVDHVFQPVTSTDAAREVRRLVDGGGGASTERHRRIALFEAVVQKERGLTRGARVWASNGWGGGMVPQAVSRKG